MKKIIRRFLAMSICLAVVFCSLAPAQPVNAATKTVNVTVCYKGKNLTFETYQNLGSNSKYKYTMKAKTYAAVKKVWGKADKVKTYTYDTGHDVYYTWKSGKTSITFNTSENGKRKGGISVEIQDKKTSIFGIKVGMSKKQALQKLRKLFGTKNVTIEKDVITEKNHILITAFPFVPPIFYLKSGKISSICFWHS